MDGTSNGTDAVIDWHFLVEQKTTTYFNGKANNGVYDKCKRRLNA